ncbi:TetR/AcrR family transcriptional regulator [Micromonospora sp. SH-82]|uniref:TetR/AcrR family transcriptional regulator n=1 Tax=Micromonospora sp. SH-82 TaxID=3132938 RepID=UPI003EBC7F45
MKSQERPGPADSSTALRPSSIKKVRAIIEAAEAIFLRSGYAEASMDDVSTLAGVSKQTVYTHFGAKQQLFVAVVTHVTSDATARVHYEIPDPTDVSAMPAYLEAYARRQLDVVLDERVLAVRRLVIAEATRFPQLAETFWQQGPAKAMEEMRVRFTRFADVGLIATPDPAASASIFNWMVMGGAINAAMLLGAPGIPDADARAQIAAHATRVFLAAHTA